MKLTRRQLYSRRDYTRPEMLLIRAVHHLWHLRAKLGGTDSERQAFESALETLFEAKRQVKAQIKAENAEKFARSTLKWRKDMESQLKHRAAQ